MVSVIIPCYNQGQYLAESVASVLAQTYSDWECIIVNDGSYDDTPTIAQGLCQLDCRIKYLSQQNAGLSAARNAGIAKASGKYILPLDADDLIMPNYIKATITEIENGEGVRLAYTGTQLFGTETKVRNDNFDMHSFLMGNCIPCTAIYYKQDWERVGGYNENMKRGYEDWDFWMCLFECNVAVKKIPQVLFHYRRTTESMSKSMTNAAIESIQQDLFKRHHGLYCKYLDDHLTAAFKIKELQRKLDLIKNSTSYAIAYRMTSFLAFIKTLFV